MSLSLSLYIYIYIYTCIYIYIYTYIYTYVSLSLSLCIYIYMYVCIYIYIYIHTCVRSYMLRARPRPGLLRARSGPRLRNLLVINTGSFHNFKSQNFKLSVSNPKNKYVAHFIRTVSNLKLPGSRPQKQI